MRLETPAECRMMARTWTLPAWWDFWLGWAEAVKQAGYKPALLHTDWTIT